MSESFPVVLPPSFFGPVSDPPSDGEAAPRANPSGAGEGRGTDRRRSGPRAAVPALEREISLVRQLISASPRPVRRRTAEGSARKPGAGRAPVGNGALRGPGAQSGPTSPPQDVTAPLGPRSRRVASPRAGALDEVFLNSPPRPGRRTAADPIDVMAPSFPVGDERMHRRSVMRTVARQRQQRQGADQSAPPLPATATDNHVTPAPATEARDPAGRAAPLPLAPPAPTFSQSQLDALVTAAARQAAEHVMARMAAAGARSEGGPGASVPAPTPPSPMPATETRTSPLSEAAPTPSEPVVVPTGSASTLVTRPAEDATELVAAAAQERVVGTQRRATVRAPDSPSFSVTVTWPPLPLPTATRRCICAAWRRRWARWSKRCRRCRGGGGSARWALPLQRRRLLQRPGARQPPRVLWAAARHGHPLQRRPVPAARGRRGMLGRGASARWSSPPRACWCRTAWSQRLWTTRGRSSGARRWRVHGLRAAGR